MKLVGLDIGTTSIAVLGDDQASFVGPVRDAAGSALANAGTGSRLSVWMPEPCTAPGIDVRPYPFGGFLAVGAAPRLPDLSRGLSRTRESAMVAATEKQP